MRICIIARSLPADYSGSFEFDQALALKSIGHDVHIISLDLRSVRRIRRLGRYTYKDRDIDISVISFPLGAINKKVFYKIGTNLLKKELIKIQKKFGDFDVIHSHFFDNACITKSVLDEITTDAKFVATEHSNISKLKAYNSNTFIKNIVEQTYASPNCLISVSNDLKNIIKDMYKADSIVLHNIVDTTIFRKSDKYDGKTVVSVGNLTPNKRMDMLVRCFAKAFEKDSEYKLIICGDGSERESLENQIRELGYENNITLLGKVSRNEISKIFEEASMFALLSEKETFGVAFIEAMAAGLPVISTKSGGPEDFINDKVGIIMSDNEESIASKMKEIIMHNHYDSVYISKYAVDNFSPEVVAKQLTEIYESL